jgi:predicted TIM-barrel fold metal-dependent hydrolase
MISSGAAARYPNIRVIFSHGGGTMPYLITRFVNRHESSGKRAGTDVRQQIDFGAAFAKFYYDTAQTFNAVPMTALKHVVPMSQILFGTDYPYRSSTENTTGLIASNAFSPEELHAIKHGNALKLFPRLQKFVS